MRFCFRFIEYFRLSKEVAAWLIGILRPHLHERVRAHRISIEIQVLSALRFFAIDCYQRSIGQNCNCGLSQISVHRCIRAVSNAIEEHLTPMFIKFPHNFLDRHRNKVEFRNR